MANPDWHPPSLVYCRNNGPFPVHLLFTQIGFITASFITERSLFKMHPVYLINCIKTDQCAIVYQYLCEICKNEETNTPGPFVVHANRIYYSQSVSLQLIAQPDDLCYSYWDFVINHFPSQIQRNIVLCQPVRLSLQKMPFQSKHAIGD